MKTFSEANILERPRIQRLLAEAVRHPVVMMCAGEGYGKTIAAADFVRGLPTAVSWVQHTERDNIGARFWESYVHSMMRINPPYAKAITRLGFPDTDDKINQYYSIMQTYLTAWPCLQVFDDFHVIEAPVPTYFVERSIYGMPQGTSFFLMGRSASHINLAALAAKGLVFNINENELRFTESELDQYFRQQGISLPLGELRAIHEDTGGWAFAINLVARSYKTTPAHTGYLRNAMKTNIFKLMETEHYRGFSDRLKNFFIRLSLIEHLSVDLIRLLAGGDDGLISEFEHQSAYVRLDNYSSVYLIHHLFLEFLREKQALLTDEDRRETYKIAADWCNRNGFKIDAISYYEKVGDYESIVNIFFEFPPHIPLDFARVTMGIFDRAPKEAFDRVKFLAVMHVRSVMRLGLWREALTLMEQYEKRFMCLPDDDAFRNQTLGAIYFCWGLLRMLMCTTDDRFDFDVYYQKMDNCLSRAPLEPKFITRYPTGQWILLAGSGRKGAPRNYIDTLARAEVHAFHCLNSTMSGASDLARGELLFYQDDINTAELFILRGLESARRYGQFEIAHMALFYLLRISVYKGKSADAEQRLKDMEELLGENTYPDRFIMCDIARAWYYSYLRMPERMPDWLKDKFAPFGHTYYLENFGNRLKARYFFLMRNYPPLLAYIQEQRQRESVLFGRVEILVMEACVHFKMNNKREALAVLKEAYEAASPNDIFIPFIGRGRDMRTLCSIALKERNPGIPVDWLETIKSKSSSYAKRQSHIIAEYKRANHIKEEIPLTPREIDILSDLSLGLSRQEIAVGRDLSINTVKMVINSINEKLGAKNLIEMIRVSIENNLI